VVEDQADLVDKEPPTPNPEGYVLRWYLPIFGLFQVWMAINMIRDRSINTKLFRVFSWVAGLGIIVFSAFTTLGFLFATHLR
jgi:hypothetical protein